MFSHTCDDHIIKDSSGSEELDKWTHIQIDSRLLQSWCVLNLHVLLIQKKISNVVGQRSQLPYLFPDFPMICFPLEPKNREHDPGLEALRWLGEGRHLHFGPQMLRGAGASDAWFKPLGVWLTLGGSKNPLVNGFQLSLKPRGDLKSAWVSCLLSLKLSRGINWSHWKLNKNMGVLVLDQLFSSKTTGVEGFTGFTCHCSNILMFD